MRGLGIVIESGRLKHPLKDRRFDDRVADRHTELFDQILLLRIDLVVPLDHRLSLAAVRAAGEVADDGRVIEARAGRDLIHLGLDERLIQIARPLRIVP